MALPIIEILCTVFAVIVTLLAKFLAVFVPGTKPSEVGTISDNKQACRVLVIIVFLSLITVVVLYILNTINNFVLGFRDLKESKLQIKLFQSMIEKLENGESLDGIAADLSLPPPTSTFSAPPTTATLPPPSAFPSPSPPTTGGTLPPPTARYATLRSPSQYQRETLPTYKPHAQAPDLPSYKLATYRQAAANARQPSSLRQVISAPLH